VPHAGVGISASAPLLKGPLSGSLSVPTTTSALLLEELMSGSLFVLCTGFGISASAPGGTYECSLG